MSLSARSIAVQGIGFGARHVALQGFVEIASPTSAGGGRRRIARHVPAEQLDRRLRTIDEDDWLMLLAASVLAGTT